MPGYYVPARKIVGEDREQPEPAPLGKSGLTAAQRESNTIGGWHILAFAVASLAAGAWYIHETR